MLCILLQRRRIAGLNRRFPAAAKRKAASKTESRPRWRPRQPPGSRYFLIERTLLREEDDGRYNDFTWKALALYRESRGEQPQVAPRQRNVSPDVKGLDLATVEPVFVPYTITEADLQSVGIFPSQLAQQAKLKFLPYRDAADAIAEKFHSDIHFLEQLNPGKLKAIKAGDRVMVPNVEAFELAYVKDIQPGSETARQAANEIEYQPETEAPKQGENAEAPRNVSIKIDTKTNMLNVFDAGKLIAAYPVTVGSQQTASPIGDWKVMRITKMPTFRYDKEMLQHGKRSGNFYVLPPGPRNPVGVVWIALNKKGIGIHGTDKPDSIGRAASHGCIRLANWDVVRLATKIKPGDSVSIR